MRKAIVKDEVFIPKQEFIHSPRLREYCGTIVNVSWNPGGGSEHPWHLKRGENNRGYCFKEEELIFL